MGTAIKKKITPTQKTSKKSKPTANQSVKKGATVHKKSVKNNPSKTSKPSKKSEEILSPNKKVSRSVKVKKKSNQKKSQCSDTKYFFFYLSIFGYLLFVVELLLYWFLTEQWYSFLELFFKNLIREPYVPTMIGTMFLLPLHTYLMGMNYPLKKWTLIGFFFIVRNLAHLTYLAMV